jgi:hypothetical protein
MHYRIEKTIEIWQIHIDWFKPILQYHAWSVSAECSRAIDERNKRALWKKAKHDRVLIGLECREV